MKRALLFSCEHGGNRVPARYRAAMQAAERALASHRGIDAGALALARDLARSARAPLVECTTTRLLADANRSRDNASLFSEWTRVLAPEVQEELLALVWQPHRTAVETRVRSEVARGRSVLHLSIHSFTPRYKGRVRKVDVGFLYDPARERELAFASAWIAALRERRPELRLARNLPYRGTSDGLVTYLRTKFAPSRYAGLELEVSQRFPLGAPAEWRRLRRDLVAALAQALDGERSPRP